MVATGLLVGELGDYLALIIQKQKELETDVQNAKIMNRKTLYIYLIILGAIAIIVFSGIFLRSKNSSIVWMNLQIEGHINKFVRIDKSIFIEVNSIWGEVLFKSYFENSNPIWLSICKNQRRKILFY